MCLHWATKIHLCIKPHLIKLATLEMFSQHGTLIFCRKGQLNTNCHCGSCSNCCHRCVAHLCLHLLKNKEAWGKYLPWQSEKKYCFLVISYLTVRKKFTQHSLFTWEDLLHINKYQLSKIEITKYEIVSIHLT